MNRIALAALLVFAGFALAWSPCAAADSPGITTVHLAGLAIGLDSQTGAIRKLDYPGPGTLLDADAGEAGLVDAAYPRDDFEPLRLDHHAEALVPQKGPALLRGRGIRAIDRNNRLEILVGLQLVIFWLIVRILEELSQRELQIRSDIDG